jgi:hypothetical protein
MAFHENPQILEYGTDPKQGTTCHGSWFLRQQSATQTYYKRFLLFHR